MGKSSLSIKLGIIGLSQGNGHPYSWSAICNGYDPEAMASCDFPAIPEYLARQSWPEDQLKGVEVTHIWTQDQTLSQNIAQSSLIANVVDQAEDMIGHIDGLLLARDDAQNHLHFAEPFLRAGLPVYIDKPIALSQKDLDALLSAQQRAGQIFSCSALRFAPELSLSSEIAAKTGPIKLIIGTTPKYWDSYAIHIIDPLLNILGHEASPRYLFSGAIGKDGQMLGLRWPDGGPDVHLMATGSIQTPIQLRILGEHGEVTLTFKDSFGAFKNALAEFLNSIKMGHSTLPMEFNQRAVEIIEMGRDE